MSKVSVYYFEGYDGQAGQTIRSKDMATLEWIESKNYKPLYDTKKEIEKSDLDGNGLYHEHMIETSGTGRPLTIKESKPVNFSGGGVKGK